MKVRKEHGHKVENIRKILEEKHLVGGGGVDICHEWSDFVDGLVAELFHGEVGGHRNVPFALAALGGYGRRDLNPYSDIDLLFLYENEVEREDDSRYTRIIPLLWDLGFKVGHSTRSINDCIKIAEEDSISKTSMIEARFLLGNRQVFDLFNYRFRKKSLAAHVLSFLRVKKSEVEERHGKHFNTLFLTEPNLKEAPGGLRDYHTALWAAAARYDVRGIRGIRERGLMDDEEASSVCKAVDFLLKVRNDLHFLTKSGQDLLDYANQPKVAERLGYTGNPDERVVTMMRDYYRSADSISRFGRSILDQAMRYRSSTQMFFLKLRHRQLASFIHAGQEEIFIKDIDTDSLCGRPDIVFRALRLMGEKELKPSPGFSRMMFDIGGRWEKESPPLAELGEGLRSLLRMEEPADVLRRMRDSRILAAIIPEFRGIRYLTPFDLYHKFTVDEHSFTALREFDNLKRTERPECEMLRVLYEDEPRKDLVRLAILVHDIGKGSGHHHEEEEIDPAVLRRLGYSDEDVDAVCRLVRLHLVMSNIAQRRDIYDKKTVTEFCGKLEDEVTLKRLYMLTFADMSAVAPGVWNSWKASLLKELFASAMIFFEGKDPLESAAPGRYIPREKMTEEMASYVKGMPDRYFVRRTPEEIEADTSLFAKFRENGRKVTVRHVAASDVEPGEFIVVAPNSLGLLHKIVGTLSARNIDIHDARILTHADGVGVDIFRVSDSGGRPIQDDGFWSRVGAEIDRVLSGEKNVEELMRNRTKMMTGLKNLPIVETQVRVLNDVSFDHTVIETASRDRLGLLYDITRIISGMGLDIFSARISTEGHRAVNTFYVCDMKGEKIASSDVMAEIKDRLTQAIVHRVY